jgi:hypothetical protein
MAHEALANPPIQDRRWKVIEVSVELILELLTVPSGGIVVDGKRITCVSDPIPETAKPAGAQLPHVTDLAVGDFGGSVLIRVYDESFPLQQEGCAVPRLEPRFEEVAEDDELRAAVKGLLDGTHGGHGQIQLPSTEVDTEALKQLSDAATRAGISWEQLT